MTMREAGAFGLLKKQPFFEIEMPAIREFCSTFSREQAALEACSSRFASFSRISRIRAVAILGCTEVYTPVPEMVTAGE
jgi:hypothetical protein